MRLIKFIFILLLIVGCKKKNPTKVDDSKLDSSLLKNGMLVLCEGLFQQNNATISWVDFSNNITDDLFFTNKTGRLLGDTGNDMKIYGGKIYVVVNVSSTIEVLDKSNGKSLKQISMMNGNIAKQPRSIAFYGSNAFVTCFDGYVDVIDTTSLSITKRIKVGSNPEGLTVSNSKLYVTNSGGLNTTKLDSTVSIINLISLEEIEKIIVGENPGSIITGSKGDVFVIARGDYSSIPSRLLRINSSSDKVESIFPFEISGMEKMEDNLVLTYKSNGSSINKIGIFDPIKEVFINSELINTTNFTTLYGVQYRSSNKKLYCLDAMSYTNSGYVKVFSSTGIFETSYHVGLNPSKLLFYE
jgi:YVTN family beta-propeller protein